MTVSVQAPARQDTCRAVRPAPTQRPHVRIRRVADEVVFDVHHGRRRGTWPTWDIAMAHANRLAAVDALALARGVS